MEIEAVKFEMEMLIEKLNNFETTLHKFESEIKEADNVNTNFIDSITMYLKQSIENIEKSIKKSQQLIINTEEFIVSASKVMKEN